MDCIKNKFIVVLILSLISLGFSSSINAAIISSNELLLSAQQQSSRNAILVLFQREDVKHQLTIMGVKHDLALNRVNSMTDAEITELSLKIDKLQTGGEPVLTIIGGLFLLWLTLELLFIWIFNETELLK